MSKNSYRPGVNQYANQEEARRKARGNPNKIVVLILRLAVYKDSILLSSLSSLLLGIACLSLFYIRRFKHTKKESPVYKIITVVLTVCGVIYTFMGAVGLLSLAGIL